MKTMKPLLAKETIVTLEHPIPIKEYTPERVDALKAKGRAQLEELGCESIQQQERAQEKDGYNGYAVVTTGVLRG